MAEWLKAAVLKTVEGHTSGGSNPSLPATWLKSFKRFVLANSSLLLINKEFCEYWLSLLIEI